MKQYLIVALAVVAMIASIPIAWAILLPVIGFKGFFLKPPEPISIEAWLSICIPSAVSVASAVVSVSALEISTSIENAHIEERRNSERLFFIPARAEIQNVWDADFALAVYLPRDLLNLKSPSILSAEIHYGTARFSSGIDSYLDKGLSKYVLKLDRATRSVIEHWKRCSALANEDLCKLRVCAKFQYTGLDYQKTVVPCRVCTNFELCYVDNHVEIMNMSAAVSPNEAVE